MKFSVHMQALKKNVRTYKVIVMLIDNAQCCQLLSKENIDWLS